MLIKAFGRKRGAFQFPISTPIFTKNFRCLFFSIFRSHSPPIAQNSKCNSNRPNFRFPPFPCMPTHAPKIVKPSSRLSSAKPHQKRPPRARKSIITTTPVVVPVKLARVRKLPLSLSCSRAALAKRRLRSASALYNTRSAEEEECTGGAPRRASSLLSVSLSQSANADVP